MRCPHCSYDESKVIDTRPTDDGRTIRRRRECLECNYRYTTYERIEATHFMVVKKDGARESFDRNKVLNGIVRACEKRPVTLKEMETVVNEIEEELNNSAKKEVKTQEIGELVMEALKKIDEVAYVRFASVYRQFKDINSFMNELKNILEEGELSSGNNKEKYKK